jgi:hypothetical protein
MLRNEKSKIITLSNLVSLTDILRYYDTDSSIIIFNCLYRVFSLLYVSQNPILFRFDFKYTGSIKMDLLVYIHLKTIINIKVLLSLSILKKVCLFLSDSSRINPYFHLNLILHCCIYILTKCGSNHYKRHVFPYSQV